MDAHNSCFFTAANRFAYHGELIMPWRQAEYTTRPSDYIWLPIFGYNRMRCMNGRIVNELPIGNECPVRNASSCIFGSSYRTTAVGTRCYDIKCHQYTQFDCYNCVRFWCRDIDECERDRRLGSLAPICPIGQHCVNGFHVCEDNDLPADDGDPYLPSEFVCLKKYGDNWYFVHTFEFDDERFNRGHHSYSVVLKYADGDDVALATNVRHCYSDKYFHEGGEDSDDKFKFDDVGEYLVLRGGGKLNELSSVDASGVTTRPKDRSTYPSRR